MGIENIKKKILHLWHRYGSLNNIVMAVALLIAASWAWGAVMMMQRNFELRRDYDARERQLQITELEVATLEYQKNYYKSDEYKDLAAREHLGLAAPGEKVLILPENSAAARNEREEGLADKPAKPGSAGSNLDQWVSFLLGKSAARLQK